jgi:hypothetical protein
VFLRGVGMGATLMPAMAAAYQVPPPAAVARAASALEVVQRAGASIGIALLAVVLEHGLSARVPGLGLSALEDLSPGACERLAEPRTAGTTFAWALVLTALAVLPAVLLPRRSPQGGAVAELASA